MPPPQPLTRAYSRHALEALALLGRLIRAHRIERRLGVAQLAERIGASRDMTRRIERGDPRCGIGLVFEAAVTVGVPLFEADRSQLTMYRAAQEEKLRLLPKSIHESKSAVKDDF